MKSRPELVVAIQENVDGRFNKDADESVLREALLKEVKVANRLEDLGFPVIRCHGIATIGNRLGILSEYIAEATHSETIVTKNGRVQNGENLNQRSIDELNRINTLLQGYQIYIKDFQLLFGHDGQPHIFDARGFFDPATTAPVKATKDRRVVNAMLLRAARKIREKESSPEHAGSPST